MKIIIRTDINPEAWGDECDERTAQVAAEKLAEALAEYAVEAWPGAEIDSNIPAYVDTRRGPLVELREVADPGGKLWEEVNAALEQVAEDLWTGCLQQAIDEIDGVPA